MASRANEVRVFVKRLSGQDDLPLPKAMSAHAAGFDLHASVSDPVVLQPGTRALVPTGLAIAMPTGTEAQIRPRSGLALKYGVTVLNTPGTIDSDYRGEIGVILINLGQESFTIRRGDRIAQIVFAQLLPADFTLVETLPGSHRDTGGFGSTGV